MKQILWIVAGSLVLVARVGMALDTQTLPADFYSDPAQEVVKSAAITAEITVASTLAKPQVDTNVTTTVTLVTPRYIGDMLIGGAGSGTSLVCVATVATTNGWLQIKP
jgi:hypothetical protein